MTSTGALCATIASSLALALTAAAETHATRGAASRPKAAKSVAAAAAHPTGAPKGGEPGAPPVTTQADTSKKAEPKGNDATASVEKKPASNEPAMRPVATAGDVKLLPTAKAFVSLIDATRTSTRPLVVHFWATWCEQCRDEMPGIANVFSEFHDDGIRVVLVSLDDAEERQGKVRKFLDEHHVQGERYLLATFDPKPVIQRVDPSWGGGLPATFVFREGVRTYTRVGPMDEPDPLLEAVDASDGSVARESKEH